MPRDGSGVYSPPAGTTATAGTPIESAKYNAFVADLTNTLNAAIPILQGGTGATTAGAALSNLGGQPLDADLTSWAGVTRASGFDTFAATPSSANLRALLTDEVGTGAAYFVGGALGTPASGTLTNCTGLPFAGLAAAAVVTEAEGISSNDNDTTIPTSAAVKDYVDNTNTSPIKAWVNFNGTGTPAIRASLNVASITDNGVGDYTINFTSAISDANYAVIASCGTTPARGVNITTQGTGSVRILVNNTGTGAGVDETIVCVTVIR